MCKRDLDCREQSVERESDHTISKNLPGPMASDTEIAVY